MYKILLWRYKDHNFPGNKPRLQTQTKKAGQGGSSLYEQNSNARDVQFSASCLSPINLSPKAGMLSGVLVEVWDQSSFCPPGCCSPVL